jgi:hypothetical protein
MTRQTLLDVITSCALYSLARFVYHSTILPLICWASISYSFDLVNTSPLSQLSITECTGHSRLLFRLRDALDSIRGKMGDVAELWRL